MGEADVRSGTAVDGAADRRERTFRLGLLTVVVLAAVVRILFSFTIAVDLPTGMDSDTYESTARALTEGHGFQFRPADLRLLSAKEDPERLVPSIAHPPFQSAFLASLRLVGLDSWNAFRAIFSILDALAVGATALLGRRIAGRRVGLLAGLIAALHPIWFQAAGFAASEASFFFLLPIAMLLLHVALERKTVAWGIAAGAAAGLTALDRSEAALLMGLFVILAFVFGGTGRHRLLLAAAVVLSGLLVVAPWLIHVKRTTGELTLSTNAGVTLVGSNCDATYYGVDLGTFGRTCDVLGSVMTVSLARPKNLDQGHIDGYNDRALRKVGQRYIRDHKGRLPTVLAARLLRTAGLFRIDHSIDFDESIGAHGPTQRVGFVVNWVLMPLAAVGAVLLGRRRSWMSLSVLGSGVLMTLVTALAVYGATRARISSEPAMAILAAVTVVFLYDRYPRLTDSSKFGVEHSPDGADH